MAIVTITPGQNFSADDFFVANGVLSVGERFAVRTGLTDGRDPLGFGVTTQTFSELQFEASGLTYRYIGNWTLNSTSSSVSNAVEAFGTYSQVIVEQGGRQIASLVPDAPLSVDLGEASGLSVAGLVDIQLALRAIFAADADQSFANLHLDATPNLLDLAGVDVGPPLPGSGNVPTPGPDFLTGTAGDDRISGLEGNDTINGLDGNDALNGNQGNDLIDGGAGRDFVQGGQGDDTLFGGSGDDIVYGDFGDDVINGNAGNDQVNGNVGNDQVSCGAGDDTLSGGQGNDSLFGDLGNDLLAGDMGNDTVTGGAGADIFQFNVNSGSDVVLDFDGAQGDRFDFCGQGFTAIEVNGSTMINLSGGGIITLTGVTGSEFSSVFVL